MVFKTLIWEGRPLVRVLLLASCKYSHKVSFAALDAQVRLDALPIDLLLEQTD